MPKFDRSDLLRFLSKPQLMTDVAQHYRISKKIALSHLQEAIKSGQVIVNEKSFTQAFQDSNGKSKKLSKLVYVFQRNPLLINSLSTFRLKGADDLLLKSKREAVSIKFVSHAPHTPKEETTAHGLSSFPFKGKATSSTVTNRFRASSFKSQTLASASKKSANRETLDHLLRHKKQSTKDQVKSFSHVEKIRFLQALLKEPQTFLDLRERFNVSKLAIKRLLKNGLCEKMVGSKGIGLRYKLTDKGKNLLKELEGAAKCEPKIRKKAIIQLRHLL